MGLSVFLPPGKDDTIQADVWFADYDRIDVAIDHADKKVPGWKRVPHGPIRVPVPLDAAVIAQKSGVPVPGSRGLVLKGELRTTAMEGLAPGTRVLSLFLVNDRAVVERDRDTQFVFQVKMELTCARGFSSRPNRRGEDGTDEDQRMLALAFRDQREWAVGHNTSVERPVADGRQGHPPSARRSSPASRVPNVVHRAVDDATLGMADLAKLDATGARRTRSPRSSRAPTARGSTTGAAEPPRTAASHRRDARRSDEQGGEGQGPHRRRHQAARRRQGRARGVQARQPGDARGSPASGPDARGQALHRRQGARVAAVPARLRAAEPALAGEGRPPRPEARRADLLPDRRRQDGGVPRPRRVRAPAPADPRAGHAARGARRRRPAALHAAAPHARSARARGHADLRARGDPAAQPEGPRRRPLHRRPVGRRERQRQPPSGGSPGALGLHVREDRLAVPARYVPVVRRSDQDREHQARRRRGEADEEALRPRGGVLRRIELPLHRGEDAGARPAGALRGRADLPGGAELHRRHGRQVRDDALARRRRHALRACHPPRRPAGPTA